MTYAELLIRKGKRQAAAFVQSECIDSAKSEPIKTPQHLDALLDYLLNPEKDIKDQDTIDWCRWLVGGGRSYEDFASNVKEYDSTALCGLVWTADFWAYRCRTCGISQCMSLCSDCFKDGNHEGHDYNFFKSQAGGACDCGDSSVMRESGFCSQHHGCNTKRVIAEPPSELMCVAEYMIPRVILRLIQHLRINSIPSNAQMDKEAQWSQCEQVILRADPFLKLLHDFSSLGSAMRTVMTKCLIDPMTYQRLTNVEDDSEYANFMSRSRDKYEDALRSLPNLEPPSEFQYCPALQAELKHEILLEELVFWTVKYQFPERLVCLLLKLLPDTSYKEALTRSFVRHYSRVSMMLMRSFNSDKLSNRIVHVSVQLFSNEELALAMTEQLSLLYIMVLSLRNMIKEVLIPCELHDETRNNHRVVDNAKHVLKDHCYWPLVSDLNNVLSHPSIAFKFMEDDSLLTMWFDFLKVFQGMDLNRLVLGDHVQYENNTYYASFTAELEAAAIPMWALVSHLKDERTRNYTANVLKHCLTAIQEWWKAMNYDSPYISDDKKFSFHYPLHRYFSVFLRQAVEYQGFALKEVLPDPRTLSLLMQHPLSCQTAFHEIMCGIWVRNGVQIKGQAMTYIQCHFCKSMVDADIFLLQMCATHLHPEFFLEIVLDRFKIKDWLSLSSDTGHLPTRVYRDNEQKTQMIESALFFLVTILSNRINLGISEEELARLEMVSLLCMGDKTHSMLHDNMPEKSGTPVQVDLFEKILSDTGTYSEPRFDPASGNMLQGLYLPKQHIWEQHYDPIHVLLRGVHLRREFQTSIERFNNFAHSRYEKDSERVKTVNSPWPPWRIPSVTPNLYKDPRRLLHSRFCHGLIFNLLYKSCYGGSLTNDTITSLAVHLLELAVTYPQTDISGKEVVVSQPWLMVHEPVDLMFDSWYPTDFLSANIRHTVSALFSHPAKGSRRRPRPSGGDMVERGVPGSGGPQNMEIDRLSDAESDEIASPPILDLALEGHVEVVERAPIAREGIEYTGATLALEGPPPSGFSGTLVPATSGDLVPMTRRHQQRQRKGGDAIELGLESQTGEDPSNPDGSSESKRAVINVNESIVTLLLRLHSKYSGRPDSYIPKYQRHGVSITEDYHQSRIGDGCFFIEKVLDRIGDFDEACAESISVSRQLLWPDYHEDEAKKDAERERREADAKKRRAKERQKQMMEQLAKQRERFIKASKNYTDQEGGGPSGSSSRLDEPGTSKDGAGGNSSSGSPHKSSPNKRAAAEDQDQSQDKTSTSRVSISEYTCCICQFQTEATENRPIGLVTLIQSSSVLAHKHESHNHLVLPTTEEEENSMPPSWSDSLGLQYDELFTDMKQTFDERSCLLAVHRGWKGGIHVQSCGHHMHYDCRTSYCETQRHQDRNPRDAQTLDFERGEFICPMCRQVANALLPVPPDPPEFPICFDNQAAKISAVASRIHGLLGEETLLMSPGPTPLRSEMSKIMEVFTRTAIPRDRLEGEARFPENAAMFISSIARTNLECDLVQRGGTLVRGRGFADMVAALNAGVASSSSVAGSSTGATPKSSRMTYESNRNKFCFVPLMHVLAIHMKVMAPRSLSETWGALTCQWSNQDSSGELILRHKNVPLMMQDPQALLTHFILLLPLNVDLTYFRTVTRACFNLQIAQTLVRLAFTLSYTERSLLRGEYNKSTESSEGRVFSFSNVLGQVIDLLENTSLFSDEEDGVIEMTDDETSSAVTLDMTSLENYAARLLIPFLRTASLVKHYVYKQDLPDIDDDNEEFDQLIKFLDLVKRPEMQLDETEEVPMDESSTPSMAFHGQQQRNANNKRHYRLVEVMDWFEHTNGSELKYWCSEFAANVCQNHIDLARKAMRVNILWKQPQLLRLHESFDQIFQYYQKRPCDRCNKVPKDPSVCLMCGTMVCMRENCCKQFIGNQATCETVLHSQECGGGTGIFLSVNSSTIIVVRGKRACVWGSVFLDIFGEEDKELKRGKPLFLHEKRYQLLEHQWVSHKFDHTYKRWVPHRDSI